MVKFLGVAVKSWCQNEDEYPSVVLHHGIVCAPKIRFRVFRDPPHKQTIPIISYEHDTVLNLVSKWCLLNQESEHIQNSNHPKYDLIPDLM